MGFKNDRQAGNSIESKLQEILIKAGVACQLNSDPSKYREYDLSCELNKKEFFIEAKFDKYCERSGNIAIEFYNPKAGKPSGIGVTTADIWAHAITCPYSIWVTSVSKLKRFILENKPLRTISCGGDDNSSMHLYKKDLIFPAIFVRIDELSDDELKKIILEMI